MAVAPRARCSTGPGNAEGSALREHVGIDVDTVEMVRVDVFRRNRRKRPQPQPEVRRSRRVIALPRSPATLFRYFQKTLASDSAVPPDEPTKFDCVEPSGNPGNVTAIHVSGFEFSVGEQGVVSPGRGPAREALRTS